MRDLQEDLDAARAVSAPHPRPFDITDEMVEAAAAVLYGEHYFAKDKQGNLEPHTIIWRDISQHPDCCDADHDKYREVARKALTAARDRPMEVYEQ